MDALRALGRVDMRWALAFYVLALDLWCIFLLARAATSLRQKVLWAVVILLCPVLGCVLWYVMGPKPDVRRRERSRGGNA